MHSCIGCRHTGICDPNAGRGQGRDCEASHTATCLAVGMPFLTHCDGGHRVSGSDSLRLRIEHAAEPEPTSRWPDAIVGAVIVLACILAAACMGVQIHF